MEEAGVVVVLSVFEFLVRWARCMSLFYLQLETARMAVEVVELHTGWWVFLSVFAFLILWVRYISFFYLQLEAARVAVELEMIEPHTGKVVF